MMEAIEMLLLLQSHCSQSRCNGSASMGEKGPFDQHDDLLPSWLGKRRLEWSKQKSKWQLEAAGYSTRIQACDFRPGFNFVREMQEAARDDERTIAILSPDYMRSLYTLAEWSAAFTRDPAGQDGTLLPIRVHSFKVDGLFAPIGYIDLVDCDQEKARQKLLDGVKRTRAKPSTPPSFPGKPAGTPSTPMGGQPQQAPDFPAR
jgi:TIR domain